MKTIVILDAKSDAAKLRNSIGAISDDLIQKTKLIMDEVAKYGDSALIDYTEKFDGVRLDSLYQDNEGSINQRRKGSSETPSRNCNFNTWSKSTTYCSTSF